MSAAYDADGMRVSNTAGGTTTYYVYDHGAPVAEMDSSGNVQALNGFGVGGWEARYYPAASGLAATFGNQDWTYTNDPQGNLVDRIPAHLLNNPNHSGDGTPFAVADTALYDSYGALLGDYDTSTPPNSDGTPASATLLDPVGFGGQYGYYTDRESGLSLLGHRYYDPTSGRFITRDPTGYRCGINLYGYAGNNPVMNADSSGFGDTPFDEIASIVFTVSDIGALAGDVEDGAPANRVVTHSVALVLDIAGWIPIVPGGTGELVHAGEDAPKLAERAASVRRPLLMPALVARSAVKIAAPIGLIATSGGITITMTRGDGRHNRASEYPHGNSKKVRKEVIDKNTVDGEVIDPKTGLPIEGEVTIEHKTPVVEHWNTLGHDMDKAGRKRWYNDSNNLTVKPKSDNSRERALLGQTYQQETGPSYSN